MKLTYRGNAYESPNSIQLGAAADQLNITLTYRGHTYTTTPFTVGIPEAVEMHESPVTLIYRGHPYTRKLHCPQSYQKSSAMALTNIWGGLNAR